MCAHTTMSLCEYVSPEYVCVCINFAETMEQQFESTSLNLKPKQFTSFPPWLRQCDVPPLSNKYLEPEIFLTGHAFVVKLQLLAHCDAVGLPHTHLFSTQLVPHPLLSLSPSHSPHR